MAIHENAPITKMMVQSPGLRNTLATITSTIHGIDDRKSTNRMRRSSIRPPAYPATRPTTTPIAVAAAIARMPTVSEMRPP